MRIGQVVFSKKGRDKDHAFIVMDTKDGYAYLVDGKMRSLTKPKKKKIKHLQITNHVSAIFSDVGLGKRQESVRSSTRGLQDADIRKELKLFNNSAIEKPISDGGKSIVKR